MNKKNSGGLYIGIALILVGMISFLELNGWLPNNFFSQYLNIIIGAAVLMAYIKNKKLPVLMIATFFFANGIIILLDNVCPGYNYIAALFMIPGAMLLSAFFDKKSMGFLVPGATLFCWGMYVFLITTGIISEFNLVIGAFFIFNGLALFIICIFSKMLWAAIPSIILGLVGIVIITLGLGPVARNILFQALSVLLIVGGLGMIIRNNLKHNKEGHTGEDE